MDCQDVLDSLYEYLDDELKDLRSKEIREHLDLCRACFGLFKFERLLREKMRQKTYHMCPENLKKRIQDVIEEYQ
ncbi:MAG: zf-HC2 domain-containing protein [Elusimicrobia bacterium]|nr:zf-HC2 domain-containing protein [Candidatus Obscuribacterium magneticum]